MSSARQREQQHSLRTDRIITDDNADRGIEEVPFGAGSRADRGRSPDRVPVNPRRRMAALYCASLRAIEPEWPDAHTKRPTTGAARTTLADDRATGYGLIRTASPSWAAGGNGCGRAHA